MSSHTSRLSRSPGLSQRDSVIVRTLPPARPAVERLECRTLLSAVLPGASVATPGTTAAAQPALAGTVIHDVSIPFTIAAGGHTVFKGDLQDRVVRETAAGTLDFYQTIRADAGFSAVALLHYVSRAGFAGVTTDANFRSDLVGAAGDHPVSASRTSSGKTVGFDFAESAVNPATQSLFYFVKTNATQYNLLGSTTIGMQQSSTTAIGAVTLATAEPVVPATPHLPQGLIDDLTQQQAAVIKVDTDVLTHAAHKQLFSDVAVLQGVVSNLSFDVVALTKAPLASVEPPLTSFLGDLLTFYSNAGLGNAAAVNAATTKGTADLEALIAAAVDAKHTNVTQLDKDIAATGGAIAAHTAGLLAGNAAAVNAALATAAVSIPAIIVDLVGGEPGGLVG